MKFLFFGIVQGLTEFLPISSSGHLYLLKKLFGINENLLASFILLHMATLLAIIIFFWKQILATFFKKKMIAHIIIITLVTVIIALPIKHFFEKFFDAKNLLSLCFLANALLLLGTRKRTAQRTAEEITLKDSVMLGIMQGIAAFPGISRSGITISGSLRRGFKPEDAFNLSFLMAIPTIMGAFLLEFKELSVTHITRGAMVLGCVAAFAFGIGALLVVKKTLLSARFNMFGYYSLMLFIASLFL
ncbi:MAG: undecaprenyl-diphosphate phosphatase [Candidatus Omnitrophica bacterium]|nr:undecaprenyl-diphosphate phosphatase [Candidatus Omnitrophota bacterium]